MFSRTHFNTAGEVKPPAFMPSPKDKKTSVFRVDGLGHSEIIGIGNLVVGKNRQPPQSPKGYGTIVVRDIVAAGLGVEVAPTSHPTHANLVNWPEQKERQKDIAIELAKRSVLMTA